LSAQSTVAFVTGAVLLGLVLVSLEGVIIPMFFIFSANAIIASYSNAATLNQVLQEMKGKANAHWWLIFNKSGISYRFAITTPLNILAIVFVFMPLYWMAVF
jgi:proP protein